MMCSKKTNEKILIIAPSWVGDVVMSQALLKELRRQNSCAEIDVLAPQYLHPLLLRMPEVHHVFSMPVKHGEFGLAERYAIGKSLRKNSYDRAIILPNSWKSALIPFFAKISVRTGWRGEMRYFLLNDLRVLAAKKIPLMVDRFSALGLRKNTGKKTLRDDAILHPKLTTTPENIEKVLKKFNLSLSKAPVIAFCIGAEYGETKRWPADYFAEVARVKYAEGYDIWLLGGEKDRAFAEVVQRNCGDICVDFTGKTDLADVIDLLSLAKAVVTNDTGLMHIAAALDIPLIAIYGSSSSDFTPPLTGKAQILNLKLPCSPCFKRKCPLGHLKCMLDLTPRYVLETLERKEFL